MRRSCQQECKLNARRALCLLLCPLYLYCVLCPVSPLCFPLCKCHSVSQRGRGGKHVKCCFAVRCDLVFGKENALHLTSNWDLLYRQLCAFVKEFLAYTIHIRVNRQVSVSDTACILGKHYLGLEKSPNTHKFPILNNLDEICWGSRWNRCRIF